MFLNKIDSHYTSAVERMEQGGYELLKLFERWPFDAARRNIDGFFRQVFGFEIEISIARDYFAGWQYNYFAIFHKCTHGVLRTYHIFFGDDLCRMINSQRVSKCCACGYFVGYFGHADAASAGVGFYK